MTVAGPNVQAQFPLIMEMRGINKSYGGALALRDGAIKLHGGCIHGLIGPNGAGKSTLVKIATGVVKPDDGEVSIEGRVVHLGSPAAAQALGIASMPQELTVVPSMSVGDNIVLGHEPRRLGIIDPAARRQAVQALIERIGLDVEPSTPMSRLAPAQQRGIMLARALYQGARLIFLDEPTAALSESQASVLLRIIEGLRDQGLSIVFVSHRFGEVERLCSDVTVMRDGRTAEVLVGDRVTSDEFVNAVVTKGAVEAPTEHRIRSTQSKPILRVEALSGSQLKGVDFEVSEGEILGICGLPDAGVSELLEILGGAKAPTDGRVFLKGGEVKFFHPADAINAGIAYLPADRNWAGLMDRPLRENVLMASLRNVWRFGMLTKSMEDKAANPWLEPYGLVPRSGAPLRSLSGGNRQKVLLARCMRAHAGVIVLDDPTVGVDINARRDIHAQLGKLADQGSAVIVSSSEPEELVAVADRVLVLVRGKVVKCFAGADMNAENVIAAVTVHKAAS